MCKQAQRKTHHWPSSAQETRTSCGRNGLSVLLGGSVDEVDCLSCLRAMLVGYETNITFYTTMAQTARDRIEHLKQEAG